MRITDILSESLKDIINTPKTKKKPPKAKWNKMSGDEKEAWYKANNPERYEQMKGDATKIDMLRSGEDQNDLSRSPNRDFNNASGTRKQSEETAQERADKADRAASISYKKKKAANTSLDNTAQKAAGTQVNDDNSGQAIANRNAAREAANKSKEAGKQTADQSAKGSKRSGGKVDDK